MFLFRTDGLEDQYSVVIRFDDQISADGFYQHFNGRRFSSLEVSNWILFLIFRSMNQIEANVWTCLLMIGPPAFELQGDICCVRYIIDVQYTGSIEHAQSSATVSAEQPSCPVCLGEFLWNMKVDCYRWCLNYLNIAVKM